MVVDLDTTVVAQEGTEPDLPIYGPSTGSWHIGSTHLPQAQGA